jgi:hypothetical protein
MKRTICILLLALMMFSCKQKKAWDNAKIENSISSYENYLTQYPNGRFSDSAAFYAEELIWIKTSKENNISAYEEYLKKFPEGRYLDSAKLLRAAISVSQSPNNIAGLEVLSIIRRKIVTFQTGSYSIENSPIKGNWLVVTIMVTPPREFFSLIPTISGSKPNTPIEPSGIGGVEGKDSIFLEYKGKPSLPSMAVLVEGGANWAAMYKNGGYSGAGYVDSQGGKIPLELTLDKSLMFYYTEPIRISLVFDVTNVQGPYILKFVDTHVN